MDTRKITVIAQHEYIVNVRRLGFIVVTLVFPFLGALGLIVVGFFSGEATTLIKSQLLPESRFVGIIDQSQLFIPLPKKYTASWLVYQNADSAQAALLSNEIAAYIVIPRDYLDSGQVTMYAKNGLSNTASVNSYDLRAFLVEGLLANKVDPVIIARASRPVEFNLVTLDNRGTAYTDNSVAFFAGFFAPYIFSFLLFIAVFSASSYLLRSVAEEKETRVIEIILSSVSPSELLVGKVIGLGALGLTQVGVWVLSSFGVSGGLGAMVAGAALVLNPGSFILASCYFLLGYLLFGTIMAIAGSFGSNIRESQQIAGLFSFFAVLPWIFAGVMFTNPNATLVRVMSFFPFTAPTMMMLRLPMSEVPWVDIAGSIASLLLTIPLVFWAGAKIFRVGLLMYGKRPSFTEIANTFKRA